jgi:eukaryotic-like serine/threonine-protein kinase
MLVMGAVLAGKYRVDRVLGQGGMGVVVQATHLQLHQPVAMKFLLPEVLTNPQIVQRFLREAQAAVRLKSEHVARVIDVGMLEEGAPYIVFEYLDGTDLARLPRQTLTIGQIVDLMLQTCEALAEAHALGIVHRDIKPANLFVTHRPGGAQLLKVLDFGISKAQHAPLEAKLTATSTVMGTPTYMSPEQMKSARDVDNRSDIWSLGIVLYELLEGAPPFAAESFGSMAVKIVTERLPPLTGRLPPGLAEVVYRCLEKEPARRFQNVAEIAHVLAPFAHSNAQAALSVERTSRVLRTDPPHSLWTLSESAVALTQHGRRPRRWAWLAGVLAVAAATVVTLVVSRGGGHATEPDAAATTSAPPPPPPADAAVPEDPPVEPVDAEIAVVLDAAASPIDAKPADPAEPPPRSHTRPPRQPAEPKPAGSGSGDVLDTRH